MAELCDLTPTEIVLAGERAINDPPVAQDPRVPANLCEITPTSAIDCAVVANLCLDNSRAARICEEAIFGGAAPGPSPVRSRGAQSGRQDTQGGLAVIPTGRVPLLFGLSFVPCPTPVAPTFVLGAGAPVQVPSGSSFVQVTPQAVGFCCASCAAGLPCEKES